MVFRDVLDVSLKLTSARESHSIPGANVKAVDLELTSLGFRGAVEFVVIDDRSHGGGEQDSLIEGFLEPDLVLVELGLEPRYRNPEEKTPVPPLEVKGLVTGKRLEENADPTHKDRAIL